MRSLLLASVLSIVAAQGWIIGRYSATPTATATPAATADTHQDIPPLMALTVDGREFALASVYTVDPSDHDAYEDAWMDEVQRLADKLAQPVNVVQGDKLVCGPICPRELPDWQ